MLNYLVVGSNGIVGSALFAHLQEAGAHVFGTTQRRTLGYQPNVFYLNLLDPVESWDFPDVKFDVVYLCAGICRMSLCEDDPQGTSKVNFNGMTTLANYLAASGAFLIYLSTNQVFSGNQAFVASDAPYAPLNEYGRQKVQVEEWIKSHCPHSAILRLTKVIEPRMGLIETWAAELKQHQTIEAFHDMSLAPVSLKQVLKVLVDIGKKAVPGCYQLSGSQDISYYDLACYLASSIERDLALVKAVSAVEKGIKKSFLPPFTTLDCSSTIALCGEGPPDLSQVMTECFDFLKS